MKTPGMGLATHFFTQLSITEQQEYFCSVQASTVQGHEIHDHRVAILELAWQNNLHHNLPCTIIQWKTHANRILH